MVDFVSKQLPLSDFGGHYRSGGDYWEFAPTSSEELLVAVIAANRRRLPMRVRGNAHSMNGMSVPRAGELLLATAGLNQYRFDREGTITVGAGAAVFDVHLLLAEFGYDLAVYNDGRSAAPSVGGFVAAGGFGAGSARHGGFWETAVSLDVVTGDGRRLAVGPGDELYRWLFGSMGQLGIVAEATLQIVPLEGRTPSYPSGRSGLIEATRLNELRTVWYTAFVPQSSWVPAIGELAGIGRRHTPGWIERPPYAYPLRCRTFIPPLIHPRQEDLAAIGIWGDIPDGFDLSRLRPLDAAITDWAGANSGYRRYVQSELLFADFDFRAHFGADCHARFVELKRELDPLGLLSRGVLNDSAPGPAETRGMAAAPNLAGHVATALLAFRVGGLIAPASRERMMAAAARLPAAASRFFGFECRLGETEPSADFLACVSAAGGQREAWARALSSIDLAVNGAWRRLADFVGDWADPNTACHAGVGNMWVEFDLAAADADDPLANLFLGSDRLTAAEAEPAAHSWLVDAVSRLSGAVFDRPRREAIAACLAALPPDGRLFQTGIMLARPDPVLRLCLRGIAVGGLPEYLGRVGWPGPRDELAALLNELAALVDEIRIDLDVGASVRSKIGLECYITEDDRLGERLALFVDYLRRARLSTETKAAALPAWYGLTHERWCGERWPRDLRDLPDRPQIGHSGGFHRTLHHIKVNFDPPAPLEAKAYLGARFVWIDDAALKRSLVAAAAAQS